MESFPEMANKVTALVRATGIEDPGRMNDAGTERPDPEVPERARRRTFTAMYKLEILAAYDAAPAGEKGALLRREGLYSSHIVQWRQARDAGALAGLAVARGRKRRDPQAERIARLEQEKRQLEQELAKTRFVVDVQAKLHALLETLSESAELAGVPEWAHVVQDGGRGARLPDPKNWARGLLHGTRPCRVGVRGLGEPAGKHAVLIVRAGSWMSSPAPSRNQVHLRGISPG